MYKNRLEGVSLIDFEIANFRTIKGRKIMYNPNINPQTQKEYLPEEKKEEVYKCDYDLANYHNALTRCGVNSELFNYSFFDNRTSNSLNAQYTRNKLNNTACNTVNNLKTIKTNNTYIPNTTSAKKANNIQIVWN
jgi:hypothetical protein